MLFHYQIEAVWKHLILCLTRKVLLRVIIMSIEENTDFIKYLKEIGFEWKNQLDYHLINDKVSVEEYRLFKKGNFISGLPRNACKIYLDLNVWIFFRDAFLGRKLKDTKWIDIYQKAIYLNEFHNVYFVISPNIYFELDKQKTSENYAALLNIIGKLSNELTIENPLQLVFDETLFCLMDMLKVKSPNFDVNNYQWDKASAIYGIPFIQTNNNNAAMIAINKTLIDAIYQIPFRDFYRLFGMDKGHEFAYGFERVSNELNQDLDHKIGVRGQNFEELYNEEFQGAIEASTEIIEDALTQFLKWHYNTNSIEVTAVKEKGLINVFPNIFRFGKIQKYFPSLQVHSGLHASIRYDKTKKFTANDLFDFHHASNAIPYCDYFITDNPLAQRLINKPLAINKKFGTKVLPANPDLILQIFEDIVI